MALTCFAVLLGASASAQAPTFPCKPVAEFPHDQAAFTQGLFVVGERIYESSGGYGTSFLAIYDLDTGDQIRRHDLDPRHFAEGIAPYRDELASLTWRSGFGFFHDLRTLKPLAHFSYRSGGDPVEAWGLAFDGAHFIMSDGSDRLLFHKPETFERIRMLRVRDGRKTVRRLNELEYANGFLLANIWKTDRLAVIDLATGWVNAWIDLSPLRERLAPRSGTANGVAYDRAGGRLLVTGKGWDKIFAIEVDDSVWRPLEALEE